MWRTNGASQESRSASPRHDQHSGFPTSQRRSGLMARRSRSDNLDNCYNSTHHGGPSRKSSKNCSIRSDRSVARKFAGFGGQLETILHEFACLGVHPLDTSQLFLQIDRCRSSGAGHTANPSSTEGTPLRHQLNMRSASRHVEDRSRLQRPRLPHRSSVKWIDPAVIRCPRVSLARPVPHRFCRPAPSKPHPARCRPPISAKNPAAPRASCNSRRPGASEPCAPIP